MTRSCQLSYLDAIRSMERQVAALRCNAAQDDTNRIAAARVGQAFRSLEDHLWLVANVISDIQVVPDDFQ